MRRRFLTAVAVGGAAIAAVPCPAQVCSQPTAPDGEPRETVLIVGTVFDQGCPGWGPTQWYNDMLAPWYNEITRVNYQRVAWTREGSYVNGPVGDVESDFLEPSFVPWGHDFWQDRPDEVDAVMVGLPGREGFQNRWTARVRVDEAGPGDCDAWQGDMQFGGDLEFLHLPSSHSMCATNWRLWGVSYLPAHAMHQVTGFHGRVWISRDFDRRYKYFADDSFSDAIAYSWLDFMHVPRSVINGVDDQCPRSHARGAGPDDISYRMRKEEYDCNFSDPTSPTWQGVLWVSGCDPQGH